MKNLSKNILGLCLVGMGLGVGAAAQAVTTAPGPYYAMPSWDQTLPAATRFIVLSNMNNEGVLDRETGLVWEQSPVFALSSWFDASRGCIELNKGRRRGWRLPSIQELSSLIDDTNIYPALPTDHPFGFNTVPVVLWSATTYSKLPDAAYTLDFNSGRFSAVFASNKILVSGKWCVRGSQAPEAQ